MTATVIFKNEIFLTYWQKIKLKMCICVQSLIILPAVTQNEFSKPLVVTIF